MINKDALLRLPPVALYFPVWVLFALVLRPVMPQFFWATMLLLPAAAVVYTERSFFCSRTGRWLLMLSAGLLLTHLAWAGVRICFYDAAVPGTYWIDDHNYFNEAAAIKAAWLAGDFPDISQKGLPPYLGTLHTGYHRPLAAAFLLFGTSTLVGLCFNACCLALLPLLAALTAAYLFPPDEGAEAGSSVRHNTPLLAGLITAFHPTQFYWASYLMKDAWTALVFLMTLTCLLGALKRRSIPLALAGALLLPYLFTVRIYASVSLLSGLLLLPALQLRRRYFIKILVLAVSTAFITYRYTEAGSRLFSQMVYSFMALAPQDVATIPDIIRQIGAGIPRLFLAPYAWVILSEPSPMYGMYPGMWYLYLLGYPLAFCGLAAAIKKNVTLAIIPLTALGMAGLLFLTAEFGGTAPRQRYYLEPLFLIFAAYGVKHFSWWWAGGVLTLELLWLTGQQIAMRM